MAQQVIHKLVDDLDGSEATETVLFSLDGEGYEIDLNAKNAAALRKAFDRYRGAARPANASRASSSSGRRGRGAKARGRGDVDPKVVRQWASENGHEISSRGRIPSEIIEAYKANGSR
jgi:hypothetical protein